MKKKILLQELPSAAGLLETMLPHQITRKGKALRALHIANKIKWRVYERPRDQGDVTEY